MISTTAFGRVTGSAEQPNEEGAEAEAGDGERKGDNGNASSSLSALVINSPQVATHDGLSPVARSPTAAASQPIHESEHIEEEVRAVATTASLVSGWVPSVSSGQVHQLCVA
jgi:hypothetical protein